MMESRHDPMELEMMERQQLGNVAINRKRWRAAMIRLRYLMQDTRRILHVRGGEEAQGRPRLATLNLFENYTLFYKNNFIRIRARNLAEN